MWCSDVVVLVALMVSCEMMDGGGVGCGALMGASSGGGYRLWWGWLVFLFCIFIYCWFFIVILIFVYIILMYRIEE